LPTYDGGAKCAPNGVLPAGAPTLTPGIWQNLPIQGVTFHGGGNDVFTQGITIDPCNAGTLYLCVCSFDVAGGHPGVYKSVDAGSTWNKVGLLDEPIHIRVDPTDPSHLYAADGVRGGTQGFWVSRDGGNTWTSPPGFVALQSVLFQVDVYDVAADPADFNHVLLTSHSPWDGYNGMFNGKWNNDDSGVLESRDGGDTWILRNPIKGWSHGNGIWFLDSNTWLLGSQADGFWRTTDGGANWKQVSSNTNMQHGGGGLFRAKSGALYAGGTPHLIHSLDGGASWAQIGPYAGFNSIIGDGARLYTAPVNGPNFITATESNDSTWTPYAGGPMLSGGPFEMAFDSANGIVYAANWTAGLWALKVK
jgi:photosystem II stability/assembly factor-like uncharacterized protein